MSTFKQQSRALCVSIVHCDLAIIIRHSADPLCKCFLCCLLRAMIDSGVVVGSEKKARHKATLHFDIFVYDTREGECQGGVTDINMR